jgi:hypothetical protein
LSNLHLKLLNITGENTKFHIMNHNQTNRLRVNSMTFSSKEFCDMIHTLKVKVNYTTKTIYKYTPIV